jgi:hypothetical protein
MSFDVVLPSAITNNSSAITAVGALERSQPDTDLYQQNRGPQSWLGGRAGWKRVEKN